MSVVPGITVVQICLVNFSSFSHPSRTLQSFTGVGEDGAWEQNTTKGIMSIRNRRQALLALALAPFLAATSAKSEGVTSGHSTLDTLETKEAKREFHVSAGFSHTFDAEFDHDEFGDVSVTRLDSRVAYIMDVGPGELGLGGFYEFSWYNLDILDDEEFNFHRLSFDSFYKGMVNENWGYFGYGAITFAADTDANLGDGIMGTVAGGARYVWSEDLSLGFGLSVSTSLEDDPRVWPVIALNWNINDRLNLRTLNGATLTYDITGERKLFVDGSVRYQLREYRLDDDALGPGSGDDQSIIESMIVGEAGVTYRFTPQFGVRGFVGFVAAREFEVRSDDDEIGDEDADAAPIIGLRAFLSF
jgi:hypothetical protein